MTLEPNSSTHPLLPPTTEDQRFDWLRLLRSRRVGISTFYRLMGDCGSAGAALDRLPDIARAAGVEDYRTCPEAVIHAELKAARQAGARLLCRGDPAYPKTLCDLDDAPPVLWAVGDADILSQPLIAMVGARNASSLGGRMARALAGGLSEAGFRVVSGMARGIDTAAHLAALDHGTIAVLGGGVDVLYPAENAKLAEDITAKGGMRLSEQPMGLQPMARHFPARNRIISGLARAVVVVEAAVKSGSLITARTALDQGREVMAVPGHPFDARASGCNLLLRDGARLVRSADDVIEALEPLSVPEPQLPLEPAVPERSLADVAQLHQQILDRLGPSPLGEDQLIRDLGASSRAVSPILTDLELDGRINRQAGGLISLIS
ncbi:DNA-processing protein DprA [Marivita sp. GX14005]|uniref:DNA-processing protein DprA n=1 Tax=Marivita sp. GX14005 TaxID=2942276 RepID=UPI002019E8BC|nr:DNA-processing protein DprA [Marivita sp. GX14005]MCL3880883.1 DNA-processing protein DprA [Marivita sp. GX14005]